MKILIFTPSELIHSTMKIFLAEVEDFRESTVEDLEGVTR